MSRNYTELKRKNGYFNQHPYQLGFMAFCQLLQTVFGPKNYLAMQLANVVFLTLAYGGTLRLLWLMTKEARAVRFGALLLMLCLQPILYVTFLYGNMASIACTLWAMCFLCRMARDGGAWRLLPAGLLCGLAVMMKPNGWIPVLAMLIVMGLWFLSEKKWKLLPLLLLLVLGPMLCTKTVEKAYSAASKADLTGGIPMTAYLAMGLQESSRAPGWYNEYVDRVYKATGYDPEKTSSRAKKNLRFRMNEFAEDPAYAVCFFHEKMVSQWNETTFEAIWISKTCPYEKKARSAFGSAALNGQSSGRAGKVDGRLHDCAVCTVLADDGRVCPEAASSAQRGRSAGSASAGARPFPLRRHCDRGFPLPYDLRGQVPVFVHLFVRDDSCGRVGSKPLL